MLSLIITLVVVALIVVGVAVCRSAGNQYGKFNQKGNNFHNFL
ncbi:MAG: hypothetical protein V4667_12510 [Bacteroidota bacterium]